KKYYGYNNFRPGQEEIIDSILSKKDTLGIMPTGGGKSLCYQIPALLLEGITLVVSPLISLMKDQVDSLNDLGIPSAYINSSLTSKEYNKIYENLKSGVYKIVYVAPERLENEEFITQSNSLNISQISIDEAHCVSQWGHDFRSSYLNIIKFIWKLKKKPIISAFTATATPEVREDIVRMLKIKPNVFITGFDRANLKYVVVKGVNSKDYIKKYLNEHEGESGIIYCATRKEVDNLYNELSKKYKIGKYHAGMPDKERNSNQEEFIKDNIEIMVATNAFGMGIDKSNVRFVIHNNLTKDLESYYQEAGRAGRDGLASTCILIFNPKDIKTQRFFIENNQFGASAEIIKGKYEKLSTVINYAHTSKCIRSYVLEYFGELPIENCENCSSCLDTRVEENITLESQKIISCIGRTKERYGINTIVSVLSGSKNASILKFRLNTQTTYGILKEYTQKEIRAFMDLLVGDGYLEITTGEYPIVILTEKGKDFIREKKEIFRKVEKIEKKVFQENMQLFENLKKFRKLIAEEEKLPPYMIFSDKTLKEMSEKEPMNQDDLLKISGVGEVKLKKYGIRFLEKIESYLKTN
ncbi:MAG: DNA helicase RecQ, partial [Fusobacteriaceae bacterium]